MIPNNLPIGGDRYCVPFALAALTGKSITRWINSGILLFGTSDEELFRMCFDAGLRRIPPARNCRLVEWLMAEVPSPITTGLVIVEGRTYFRHAIAFKNKLTLCGTQQDRWRPVNESFYQGWFVYHAFTSEGG